MHVCIYILYTEKKVKGKDKARGEKKTDRWLYEPFCCIDCSCRELSSSLKVGQNKQDEIQPVKMDPACPIAQFIATGASESLVHPPVWTRWIQTKESKEGDGERQSRTREQTRDQEQTKTPAWETRGWPKKARIS